jgi:hypothetical protein
MRDDVVLLISYFFGTGLHVVQTCRVGGFFFGLEIGETLLLCFVKMLGVYG